MTKGRPDILLYKVNFLVVLALCIAVAVLYWFAWVQHESFDIGFRVVGFHAQKLLGIKFGTHLANEFEAVLTKLLMFVVPLVGASSAFLITHEYDVLWWLRRKPTSIRARIYSSLVLFLGSFALLYLSSDVTVWILESLSFTDDQLTFYGVAILTAIFFPVVSSFMLLGLLGFINTFEKSKVERMRKK